MPRDRQPPVSATDENVAPHVPSDASTVCYHCPNAACDGHHYLRPRDSGRELICPKCGLAVTIGKSAGVRPSLIWCAALVLVGVLIGFLAALVVFRG
jgi:uncharacterized paraquat-inducible protein A